MKHVYGPLPKSALRYVLEGLIPYTDANAKLALHPGLFFNELEKISRMRRRTLQNSYYRAIQNGYIQIQGGRVEISEEALTRLRPFAPQKLSGSQLMVIFDIAESDRWKRQQLRLLLRQLRFEQVQRSVWQSQYDSRNYLAKAIDELGLKQEVLVYEARQLVK